MTENQKADLIADAVREVGRSKAPYFEFAPGPFADAVHLAVAQGYLDSVGNSVVQITEKGRRLLLEKDPGGRVLVERQVERFAEQTGMKGAFIMLPNLLSIRKESNSA